jgi:hypothetical protein
MTARASETLTKQVKGIFNAQRFGDTDVQLWIEGSLVRTGCSVAGCLRYSENKNYKGKGDDHVISIQFELDSADTGRVVSGWL